MTTLDDFADLYMLDGRTRVALAAFVREVEAASFTSGLEYAAAYVDEADGVDWYKYYHDSPGELADDIRALKDKR